MSDKQKTASPIWLLSFVLLFSATTCYVDPIKYTREAVHLRTDKEILIVQNDSLRTELELLIWPKYIKPKKEVIITVFLEYGKARQFITRDTTRYHPGMSTKNTEKYIRIDVPLDVRLTPGYGNLTYSLKYRSSKTGAYREAYEPSNWSTSDAYFRPIIAKVFADSASYIAHQLKKPPNP